MVVICCLVVIWMLFGGLIRGCLVLVWWLLWWWFDLCLLVIWQFFVGWCVFGGDFGCWLVVVLSYFSICLVVV